MGKKKINNKELIRDSKKRQVTFYKRSKGAIKKLLELHHLCGAQIFSIIMSDTGKMIVVNKGGSPSDLINKYINFKLNNKPIKEFSDLDQIKLDNINESQEIVNSPGGTTSKPIQEGVDESSLKYVIFENDSTSEYNELYCHFENKKLVLENEDENLNCLNDSFTLNY